MTRREWMAAAGLAGLGACGRKRSPRYQGYALIANHDGRNVAFIDLSRFQVLKEVSVGINPDWVFAAAPQMRAYVLGADSDTLVIVNLDDLSITARIAQGGKPRSARISPDGKSLWIALHDPNALVCRDLRTGARTRQIRLPTEPGDMDLYGGAGADDQIAMAFPDSQSVGCMNVTEGRFRYSQPLGAAPGLVRFRRDGKSLFAACAATRTLVALDCAPAAMPASATLQRLVDLPLPLAPRHVCFNSDGGQMFLTGDGMDAVTIVSPYQTEIGETILAGSAPGAMAASTSGTQFLFVANPISGDVTVIDIDTRRVLAQIPVGQKPSVIVLTPDNEYALVLNEQSGDVAVIRLMSIRNADLNSRRARTAPLFTMMAVGSRPVSAAIFPRTI